MITGTFQSQGLTIAYHRSEVGEPVVLVHGAMADHTAWDDQIEFLNGRNTVIAWDGPGSGDSDDPPEGYSLDDYVAALDHLFEHLDIPAAHVVGHSFGGELAIDFQLHTRAGFGAWSWLAHTSVGRGR